MKLRTMREANRTIFPSLADARYNLTTSMESHPELVQLHAELNRAYAQYDRAVAASTVVSNEGIGDAAQGASRAAYAYNTFKDSPLVKAAIELIKKVWAKLVEWYDQFYDWAKRKWNSVSDKAEAAAAAARGVDDGTEIKITAAEAPYAFVLSDEQRMPVFQNFFSSLEDVVTMVEKAIDLDESLWRDDVTKAANHAIDEYNKQSELVGPSPRVHVMGTGPVAKDFELEGFFNRFRVHPNENKKATSAKEATVTLGSGAIDRALGRINYLTKTSKDNLDRLDKIKEEMNKATKKAMEALGKEGVYEPWRGRVPTVFASCFRHISSGVFDVNDEMGRIIDVNARIFKRASKSTDTAE